MKPSSINNNLDYKLLIHGKNIFQKIKSTRNYLWGFVSNTTCPRMWESFGGGRHLLLPCWTSAKSGGHSIKDWSHDGRLQPRRMEVGLRRVDCSSTAIRTDDEYADVISRPFVARRPSGIYWWSRRAPPNSEWRQGDLAMKDGSILIAEGSIWLPTAIRGRWRSRGRNGNEVSAWQLVVHAALFCSTSPPRWCKTKIYITYQNYTSSSISTSSVEVLFFYNVMLKLDVTSPSLLWVTC
jgi:hypothetical protein